MIAEVSLTGAGAGAGTDTSNDFWRTGCGGEGSGTDAGAGAGALSDFVAMGTGAGMTGAWCPGAVDPLERSTRIRGADLPAKNSAAVRDDSRDGAGGNISAWKESAWVCVTFVRRWFVENLWREREVKGIRTFRGTMKAMGSTKL